MFRVYLYICISAHIWWQCRLSIFKIAIKVRRFADDNAVLISVEEWFYICKQRLSSKHRFIIFSHNKTIGLTYLVIMCNILSLQILIADFFLYKLINSPTKCCLLTACIFIYILTYEYTHNFFSFSVQFMLREILVDIISLKLILSYIGSD